MRKLLAIALLLVLGMPMASSALALLPGKSSEANVPVCCRRGGAHHCSMADAAQTSGDQPAFALLTERCPFPTAHPGNFRSGASAGILPVVESFHDPVAERSAVIFATFERLAARPRSNQKRGPPTS